MATSPQSRAGRGHNFAVVYGELREAILHGQLEPGAITTQMALAEQFSVGRTPLREAMRVLQMDGLVVNEPNRRVQITPLTAVDAIELYSARILMESMAILQTIPTATSRDDAEMLGYLAQMDHYGEGRDWAALQEPHRSFHARLWSGGGARMIGMIEELYDHAERYRLAASPSREFWMKRQTEHRAITAAAGERDAERTAELVVEHYTRTLVYICADLDPDADLGRLRGTLQRVAPVVEDVLDKELRKQRRSKGGSNRKAGSR